MLLWKNQLGKNGMRDAFFTYSTSPVRIRLSLTPRMPNFRGGGRGRGMTGTFVRLTGVVPAFYPVARRLRPGSFVMAGLVSCA